MTVAPRRQAMLFADGRVLGCAAAWVAGARASQPPFGLLARLGDIGLISPVGIVR